MPATRFAPIAVVGPADDPQLERVIAELRRRDIAPLILDPRVCAIDGEVISLGGELGAIVAGGVVSPPAAVYVRSLQASPLGPTDQADAEMQRDWRRTLAVHRERTALLRAVILRWAELGAAIYNDPRQAWRITKPYQLSIVREAGVTVPDTLWTADPEGARAFCANRRVIYKPVTGGAHAREITASDLTSDRLAALRNSPVCFQELLPGASYRVFVIDGRIVAALRIDASELDYRGSELAITRWAIPHEVARNSLRAAEALQLRFTGIDFKEDAGGCPIFLEANDSPMFAGFEDAAGCDVGGALAEAMLARCPMPGQMATNNGSHRALSHGANGGETLVS